MQVALQVVEQRKKLRDTRRFEIWVDLKFGWIQSLVASLSCRNKTLAVVIKNYAKADISTFWSCLFLLFTFTLLQIFCPALQI